MDRVTAASASKWVLVKNATSQPSSEASSSRDSAISCTSRTRSAWQPRSSISSKLESCLTPRPRRSLRSAAFETRRATLRHGARAFAEVCGGLQAFLLGALAGGGLPEALGQIGAHGRADRFDCERAGTGDFECEGVGLVAKV